VTSFGVGLSREQKDEAAKIASELARIAKTGEVLPGSIVSRRTHCGARDAVACGAAPAARALLPMDPQGRLKDGGRWLSPNRQATTRSS